MSVNPQFKKYFTVAEANALLPKLVTILDRIRDTQTSLGDISDKAAAIHRAVGGNGGGDGGPQILDRSARVAKYLKEITELGVLVKDLESGLLDFPHLREGREVFLCWKKGENKISFWHELDSGFKGRKPL